MSGGAEGARVELRLLGELEILVEGRVQPLPASKKTRALLGYLVSLGRPQRRQRLCDLLWEGPDDPRAALRWSLAKLRPLLDVGCTRLVADREHVAFAGQGAEVDVLALAKLRHVDLDAAATTVLVEALARFRGPFLEGLELASCPTFNAWCVGEREAWRALHVQLIAKVAERQRGSPEQALRHARAWVALEPLAEAPRALVIDLLAALGDARRALAEFEDFEKTVRRELGTQPSFELQQRRMALARGLPAGGAGEALTSRAIEPAPDQSGASLPGGVSPEARRQVSGGAVPLVGRTRERALIEQALRDAQQSARVLLLTGEPGIGKSRLLEALADLAREAGGTVWAGRAFEAEAVRPYGPFIDALRAATPTDARPDQASPFSGRPTDRTSLYDAVVDLLSRAAERAAPVVLILDDVHWLDEASAELTHYLVRGLRERSVLFAVAARAGELGDNPAAQRLFRALARQEHTTALALGPLAAKEIEHWLGAMVGDAAAQRLSAECGGNPLLALELARALGGGAQDPAASLANLIADRFLGLPESDHSLLGWAAALGRGFDVNALAHVTGLGAAELLACLERLERHGILRSRDSGYDFAHDLIRQVAYRQLSPPRQRLLHLHIARALSSLAGTEPTWMNDVAHHAALGGDAPLAVRASIAAGRRCLRLFAFREAAELAIRAEPLAAKLAQDERVAALIDLAEIRLGAELRPDVEARLLELADEARGLGMATVETRAFYLRSVLHFRAGDPNGALDTAFGRIGAARHASREHLGAQLAGAARCCLLLEKNLKVAADFVNQAKSLLGESTSLELAWSQGMLAHWQGKLDEAAAGMAHALSLARREHAYWEACECLLALAFIGLDRGRHDEALGHADELAALAERVVEGPYRAAADGIRALVELARDPASGFAPFDRSLLDLRRASANRLLALLQNRAARLALRLGDAEQAQRYAREALEAAEVVGRAIQSATACIVLAEIALERAEPAGAREYLDRVAALVRTAQVPRRLLPELKRLEQATSDGKVADDDETPPAATSRALRIVSSP